MRASIEGAVLKGEGKLAGLVGRRAVGVSGAVLAHGSPPSGNKSLKHVKV